MTDTLSTELGPTSQDLPQRVQALKKEGLNKSQVSRSLGINRGTVSKYWGDNATFEATESIQEYGELGEAVVTKKPDVGRISTLGGLLARRFLYNPKRVAAILQRFYKAAQEDNRVLLKYMEIILPSQQGNAGVMVNVATSIKMEPGKKYDINGEEIVIGKRSDTDDARV